ncbi:hypothetical protein O987_17860 [Comamonas testosteroni TK102]|uniref:Uncharacterized protein n=1 Tax=Comamonas testosteroni TK102 TaxID=1392005 RepID=A0A076PV57_COMTE|nr:hypothetical protein O987_17860 [Comamonas testosteroni TK102]
MSIQFRDLPLKLRLSAIARMPHADNRHAIRDSMSGCGSIVADGDDARGTKQNDELL